MGIFLIIISLFIILFIIRKKNNKNGFYEEFHSNGKLKSQTFWKSSFFKNDTRKVGLYKKFSNTGILIVEGNYDEDGWKHGVWKNFLEETGGVLGNVKSGELFSKELWDHGNLISDEINPKLNGSYTIKNYLEEYNVKSSIQIIAYDQLKEINGKMCSITRIYGGVGGGSTHSNLFSGITYTVYYKSHSFDKNGQLEDVLYFKDGLKYGLCKSFYKNGKIMSEGTHLYNQRHGMWKGYHEDGKLRKECTFSKGKITSNKEWDKKGNEIEFNEENIQKNNVKKTTPKVEKEVKKHKKQIKIKHTEFDLIDGKIVYEGKPFTGIIVGVNKSYYNVVNGLKHGESLSITNDSLGNYSDKITCNFNENKLQGYYTSYYSNGNIKDQYIYEDGIKSETLFENGEKINSNKTEENIQNNDEKETTSNTNEPIKNDNGFNRIFNDDGGYSEFSWKNKQHYGELKMYNKEGILTCYIENLIPTNFDDPLLLQLGSLGSSFKDGKEICRYNDGSINYEVFHIKGKLDGIGIQYDERGWITQIDLYKDDKDISWETNENKKFVLKEIKKHMNNGLNVLPVVYVGKCESLGYDPKKFKDDPNFKI